MSITLTLFSRLSFEINFALAKISFSFFIFPKISSTVSAMDIFYPILLHPDVRSAQPGVEGDLAFPQSHNGEVAPQHRPRAGFDARPLLADDNVAGNGNLPAINLDSQP